MHTRPRQKADVDLENPGRELVDKLSLPMTLEKKPSKGMSKDKAGNFYYYEGDHTLEEGKDVTDPLEGGKRIHKINTGTLTVDCQLGPNTFINLKNQAHIYFTQPVPASTVISLDKGCEAHFAYEPPFRVIQTIGLPHVCYSENYLLPKLEITRVSPNEEFSWVKAPAKTPNYRIISLLVTSVLVGVGVFTARMVNAATADPINETSATLAGALSGVILADLLKILRRDEQASVSATKAVAFSQTHAAGQLIIKNTGMERIDAEHGKSIRSSMASLFLAMNVNPDTRGINNVSQEDESAQVVNNLNSCVGVETKINSHEVDLMIFDDQVEKKVYKQ